MANFFKPNKQKLVLGQVAQVKINRLDFNGCGVGQYKNKAIFIENTLPNEVVNVKIIEQKNKYSRGKLLDIALTSEQRINPHCQHFSLCGGCDLQHLSYDAQITFKKKKVIDLFARNNLSAALPWQAEIVDEPWHYRRKARIGVQYNKANQVTIGFRQKSSNQLTAIKNCPVLSNSFSELFTPLKKLLAQLSGKNPVGHIEVIESEIITSNAMGSGVASSDVINVETSDNRVVTLVIRQLEKLNENDKQLWLAFSEKHECHVLFDDGKQVKALKSEKSEACRKLSYRLDPNITIEFSPENFIQVNHSINKQMIAQALDWLTLTNNDDVLDLFCGLGNFSLPLAKHVASVVGIEGIETMVAQAQKNAEINRIDNCQFYQADLNSDWSQEKWAQQKFSKLLLDPARAGAFEALQQLIPLKIATILYVSCDPATLARDSQLLIEQGYTIEKIALVDMFSQTKHIETMVLFKL
jgi:23S rRNA (uracil1939-C5)-methyltransferase